MRHSSTLFKTPFGSSISEMQFSSDTLGKYRFGFNSQEKDDEVSGVGNSYTAEYWQYDSRLGRRFNTDPVFKAYESPYACFGNSPIRVIDPNGKDSMVTQLTRIYTDDSKRTKTVLLQTTFYVIRKGVWSKTEATVNSTGSSEICFMMPEMNWEGTNKMDAKDFYNILWKSMGRHPEWKNTILIQATGRGQFAHPGTVSDNSAGCLIACSKDLTIVYHKPFKDEHDVLSPGWYEVFGSNDKTSALSKEMLASIKSLYDVLEAGNTLPNDKFGFILTTNDVSQNVVLNNNKNSSPNDANNSSPSNISGSSGYGFIEDCNQKAIEKPKSPVIINDK